MGRWLNVYLKVLVGRQYACFYGHHLCDNSSHFTTTMHLQPQRVQLETCPTVSLATQEDRGSHSALLPGVQSSGLSACPTSPQGTTDTASELQTAWQVTTRHAIFNHSSQTLNHDHKHFRPTASNAQQILIPINIIQCLSAIPTYTSVSAEPTYKVTMDRDKLLYFA